MPWQMSYAAVAEAENAELQTDVMRFMAILAFCLVAIFAIVQSMPAPPATPVTTTDNLTVSAPEVAKPAVTVPVTTPAALVRPAPEKARVVASPAPTPIELQRAAPLPRPVAPPPVQVVRAPAPQSQTSAPQQPDKPVEPVVQAEIVETPTTPAPPTQGLSLRFESDAVLRSLVARGLVSLYAIRQGQFYAMQVNGGDVRFTAAGAPAQYHEMIDTTVPAEIRNSLGAANAVTWGVTLPNATSQQLMRFVRTNYSGSLVIGRDAQLALGRQGV